MSRDLIELQHKERIHLFAKQFKCLQNNSYVCKTIYGTLFVEMLNTIYFIDLLFYANFVKNSVLLIKRLS